MLRSLTFSASLIVAGAAAAQTTLPPAQLAQVDAASRQALQLTGVPSASVAIVKDGKIVAERAYGLADIAAHRPAAASTRYPIGSVSKQFTAAMIMLLVQDGKLSLDDHVGRFLPELTDANDITIRQILSHTSGYTDFWPEDYSPVAFRKPTTPQALVDDWGRRKLDFAPGTAWQYSNTGYAMAALIVEKAGGAPFYDQLQKRILQPLRMNATWDYDGHGVPPGLTGYERYAYSPPRPAPLDQPGWSFGSGGLAMTAHDLALWDISVMNRSLLTPSSYDALETEVKLKDGSGTGYALGLQVGERSGHKYLEHSGEETGFVSENIVLPDDHEAIAVLTNQDASRAAAVIAREAAQIVFGLPPEEPKDPDVARALATIRGLAQGKIDRASLNANAQSYFTPAVLADYANSLRPLGMPLSARERVHQNRGGMVFHAYVISYPAREVTVTTYELADGRYGQFLIVP